jgi:hypothetical protein
MDAEFRLMPTAKVAFYHPEKPNERAVYSGSVVIPNVLFFECEEKYNRPDEEHFATGPWSGQKLFAQKSPGEAVRKRVREYTAEIINKARAEGKLLALASEIARNRKSEAKVWSEARIKYLTTFDEETLSKWFGSLSSAISACMKYEMDCFEQADRVATMCANIRALGREFDLREEDGDLHTCLVFGSRG